MNLRYSVALFSFLIASCNAAKLSSKPTTVAGSEGKSSAPASADSAAEQQSESPTENFQSTETELNPPVEPTAIEPVMVAGASLLCTIALEGEDVVCQASDL